jgi:hypothetical protein
MVSQGGTLPLLTLIGPRVIARTISIGSDRKAQVALHDPCCGCGVRKPAAPANSRASSHDDGFRTAFPPDNYEAFLCHIARSRECGQASHFYDVSGIMAFLTIAGAR